MEAVGDFVKNLGLLDLLIIVLTVILILAGILILIFGRSRRLIYGFLSAAVLPLLLGLLGLYLKNLALDRGFGLVGHLSAEGIAAARREALIIAAIGVGGTFVLVLMGLMGLALKWGGKP